MHLRLLDVCLFEPGVYVRGLAPTARKPYLLSVAGFMGEGANLRGSTRALPVMTRNNTRNNDGSFGLVGLSFLRVFMYRCQFRASV